jgi:predicted nucleic acid-binding protein
MTLDHTTLLFFDASCLIAASASPNGGSGFLLSLCGKHQLSGAISQSVLLETERNIQAKMGQQVLRQYHELLLLVPLTVAPVPKVAHRQPWQRIVNAKDHHVVAAALECKAPYLLTLDRQLNLQTNQAGLTLQAVTPGEFIKSALPHHVNYPSLRT